MRTIKITKNQANRIAKDLRKISGENGDCEFRHEAYWYFGSELEVLRLAIKYRDCKKANHGYSENLKTWYFKIEMPSFTGEVVAD